MWARQPSWCCGADVLVHSGAPRTALVLEGPPASACVLKRQSRPKMLLYYNQSWSLLKIGQHSMFAKYIYFIQAWKRSTKLQNYIAASFFCS